MQLPFEIGQRLFAPRTRATAVTRPCPACLGQKVVTIIYGDGEHVQMRCEACGTGFDEPRGVVSEYELEPQADEFVIASVESLYNGNWRVNSTTGAAEDFKDLCETEEQALEVSRTKCSDQYDRNMASRLHKRKSQGSRLGWSVAYHRQCIRDLERQLEWHRSRVSAKGPAASGVVKAIS